MKYITPILERLYRLFLPDRAKEDKESRKIPVTLSEDPPPELYHVDCETGRLRRVKRFNIRTTWRNRQSLPDRAKPSSLEKIG